MNNGFSWQTSGLLDKFRETGVQRLVLIEMILFVYGVSLTHEFVWDDRVFFIGNPAYRDFNLRAIFFSLANGVEFLPLRDLTYAFDYLVWGERPFGFHLTNLLFFAASLLAFWQLIRALPGACFPKGWDAKKRERTALLTALLFSVHPLNSEAVNFITCRNVLLSGLFAFLSWRYYLQAVSESERWGRISYWMSLALFACALLSKATIISLPLLLLLTGYNSEGVRERRNLLLTIPFFLLAAGAFILHLGAAGHAHLLPGSAGGGPMEMLTKCMQITLFYLEKLFFPVGLSAEYGQLDLLSHTGFHFRGGVFFFLLLVGGIFFRRHAYPELTLSLGWFLIGLLPVLNLFNTNPAVADRYLFLPAGGFFFFTAISLVRLEAAWGRKGLFVAALLILCWGGISLKRSLDWKSNETLWQANIRTASGNLKGYVNLAAHYFALGEPERGLEVLAKGRRLPGGEPYYGYFLGMSQLQRRDARAATETLRIALESSPDNIRIMTGLGMAYQELKAFPQAIEQYERVLALQVQDPYGCKAAATENLALIRAAMGERAP